jgi:hypothetical protein
MAKAFREAFQKYKSQIPEGRFSLVSRLQQRKAPPYVISAAQSLVAKVQDLVQQKPNLPEFPGLPKMPKLGEKIDIPPLDFDKIREQVPSHLVPVVDILQKFSINVEKKLEEREEPTRIIEAFEEKIGEFYEEGVHLQKVLKDIEAEMRKEQEELKKEWDLLLYEFVNNKLAKHPDLHKKIEDEILELRFNREDLTRDTPVI